jgi:hypothetical protein
MPLAFGNEREGEAKIGLNQNCEEVFALQILKVVQLLLFKVEALRLKLPS